MKENSHKHAKWRDTKLEHFICRRIKEHHSPEIISAKIPAYFEGKTLSHTSIYTMIRKHRPEWAEYLPHHGRRKKLTHAASKDKIPNRTDISERPADINDRSVFGHYAVLSCREGKSCLVVLVERKTRKYFIVKVPDKTAESMKNGTLKRLKAYRLHMTTDLRTYCTRRLMKRSIAKATSVSHIAAIRRAR